MVANAIYTQNRCSMMALDFTMLDEAWSGMRPYIAHIRVLRCVAYAMVPYENRGELDANDTK